MDKNLVLVFLSFFIFLKIIEPENLHRINKNSKKLQLDINNSMYITYISHENITAGVTIPFINLFFS